MPKERLRIVFITPGGTTSRGGMGSMAEYLTQALQRSYPELDVRVLDSYGDGRKLLMPVYFVRTLLTLLLLCIFRRPHLLHLNLAAYGSTGRKLVLMHLARLFRVPTLLHVHASKFVPFCEALGPRARRALIGSLSRADRIVVIGQYWRRYFVDTLGIAPERVVVIYNAVPMGPRPAVRPADGPCNILALGLLGPRKGTPELLDALASPSLRSLDCRAVIAGNGAVEESRRRATELGLTGRVEFPGWVDKVAVARLLSVADVFVLPSHHEGLPVAILEAMAAGVPVVTTPVGAIPELVIDGQTGLLVPPGNARELAAALARLVADPELRRRLADAAREQVESHFQITVMAERFAALYRELTSTVSGSGEPLTGSSLR